MARTRRGSLSPPHRWTEIGNGWAGVGVAFLTEEEPPRGVLLPVLPGIGRVVAPNAGPMTYHGTNTYLIEESDGLTLLDPGPDDERHIEAVARACGGRLRRILVSHTHSDHFGATAAIQAATGAEICAFHPTADAGFEPGVGLRDGNRIGGFTAIHTPGHAADHQCFAFANGILFSGDHVMAWSSTVVSPPGGDMAAYMQSLNRLLERSDLIYLPGHGPQLRNPHLHVRDLIAHRRKREAAIEQALSGTGQTATQVADILYAKENPRLRRAAERNVLAHLIKLEGEGRARQVGEVWTAP